MSHFITKLQSGHPFAIVFCVAAFSVLATLYSFYFQYRVWNWPSVWGELLKSEVSSFGTSGSRDYSAKVEYNYSVESKDYTGHRLSAMPVSGSLVGLLKKQLAEADTNEDGKVKVYYDPKRPHKAFLIRGAMRQVIFTFLYFLGALWVTYLCAIRLNFV